MKQFIILFISPFFVFSQIDYNTEIQPILDTKCTSCHQDNAGLLIYIYADGRTEKRIKIKHNLE